MFTFIDMFVKADNVMIFSEQACRRPMWSLRAPCWWPWVGCVGCNRLSMVDC